MRNIAIIGGTGIYDAKFLDGFENKIIDTPYGQAACKVGELYGNKVTFITRHGVNHGTPPNKVNYRANIWALKSLGVEEIFATTAVGSLNAEMKAGHFVVCDNTLDFTKSRINTFYDDEYRGIQHVVIVSTTVETNQSVSQKSLNISRTRIDHTHNRFTFTGMLPVNQEQVGEYLNVIEHNRCLVIGCSNRRFLRFEFHLIYEFDTVVGLIRTAESKRINIILHIANVIMRSASISLVKNLIDEIDLRFCCSVVLLVKASFDSCSNGFLILYSLEIYQFILSFQWQTRANSCYRYVIALSELSTK